MGLMRRLAGLLLALAAALWAVPVAVAGPEWQGALKVAGIFDLGGPRPDGRLVVAGAGALYLLEPNGTLSPFAQGPSGYADDKGGEPYLAVSPGLPGAGCDFQAGDVYILRLHAPLGITRVDVQGRKSAFASIPGVKSLNGIAFDTAGLFGRRLLATGSAGTGKTEVVAVDCSGNVQVLTRNAPVVEGGLAVAPLAFAKFGGKLIAPDELSGNIYAIGPDGSSALVVKSGLPAGGDTGVEGVAFVQSGFMAGGSVFYSDRATPGNRHPGNDVLLRLTSADLSLAGVHDGDLLAVTEGGATMIAVSCSSDCGVTRVVGVPTTSHGEGHIAFTVGSPVQLSPIPIASPSPQPKPGPLSPAAFAALIVAAVVLGAGALVVLRERMRSTATGSAPPSR
jgi:hypothetical protein